MGTEIDTNRLARREKRAHEKLELATDSWVAFVDEINAIHVENDWTSKAGTWERYIALEYADKLAYGYSRLRQLQAAQPMATRILQATGVVLNERQVRFVKKELGYDENSDDLPEVIKLASEAATKIGQQLAPRHIRSAHDVLQEEAVTNGSISLEGESMPVNGILGVNQVAILQNAIEANDRRIQYIAENSKSVILTRQVTMVRDNHGAMVMGIILPELDICHAGMAIRYYFPKSLLPVEDELEEEAA